MSTTLLYILNNNNGRINVDGCDEDAVNWLQVISYSLSNSIHFTLISFDLRQRMPVRLASTISRHGREVCVFWCVEVVAGRAGCAAHASTVPGIINFKMLITRLDSIC